MEYNYSRVYSRKDKSVEFFKSDPEFLEYVKIKYIDTNKCKIFREQKFLDSEELILEITTVWQSAEGMEEARVDIMFSKDDAKRREYNESHGITLLSIVEY